jgi:hypothetical protein
MALTNLSSLPKWRHLLIVVLFFMLLGEALWSDKFHYQTARDSVAGNSAAVNAAKLPMLFEENRGQADPSVRFVSHTPGGTLLFSRNEVMLRVMTSTGSGDAAKDNGVAPLESGLLRLQFVGANASPEVQAGQALSGKVNYLLGNDPGRWHTNLSTYSEISYVDLYDGVTLKYEGNDSNLKGTYVVAPGADPGSIRWRYSGAESVSLNGNGSLEIITGSGSRAAKLLEQAPIAWQDIQGQRMPVRAGYSLAGDGEASFVLGSYNRDYPLIIDPTIVFSTYLGGEDQDQGLAITVDAAGFIYVAGEAQSADFPTTPGAFQNSFGDGLSDAFVTKFAPDGTTLVYSTYLGGDLTDIAHDFYVDGAGNAYLTGMTTSANFPTTPGAFQTTPPGDTDAFVTKLNPSGSGLIYSTYLGGLGELGGDEAYSIAVDVQGNAYVTGVTGSRNFPVVNPFQADCRPAAPFCHDAFVSKLNPAGSALLFSTYLGGRSVFEEGQGIAVNAQGNAYVTGFTDSDDFPLHNPIKPSMIAGDTDAFVTEFSLDGSSLVYSTYLGGYNAMDKGYGIALDSSDNIYVTGWTDSGDFPTANPYQATFAGNNDGFVTKLNPTGTAYLYSTYLGRFGTDIAYDIALDQANNMYVTGYTSSEDFPVVNAVQPIYGGFYDAFVTAIDASGGPNLIYSTYLGGTSYEHGFGIAVGGGNTYVTGDVVSTDFPTTNPYQPQLGGDGSYTDAFVVKIAGGAGGTPTPTLAVTGTVSPTSVPSTTATRTSTPVTGTAIATATATGTSMPGMTATSQASTATPTTCVVSFTDVPSSHTFYQYVTCLACRGILGGYNDGTFRPNSDITRGQIAKVVSNAAGFNESPAAQIYDDVPASNAFYAWVNRLSMRGVMSGYPCGTVPTEPCGNSNRPYFRPNASATRGQLSKIVASAKGINTTPTGETYQDVDTTHTFYVWIEQLSNLGVMGGYPCGIAPAEPCGASNKPYFRSNNNVTRGQASKIVAGTFFPNCRALQKP